jgi:serine/threonine-protein kinase
MSSPFASGTKLGRYEIRSKLGAGGMGEVYLAEDTELHPQSCVKGFARRCCSPIKIGCAGSNRKPQRPAALNHPNIAHIYEIGEKRRTHFIAMEFVDGRDTTRVNSQKTN